MNGDNHGGEAAIVLTILFFATALFGLIYYGAFHFASCLLLCWL